MPELGSCGLKLLIVEDEKVLVMSLRYLVEADGKHEVGGTADDLPSALKAVEANRPDLALVDIQLARGASGFEVAAALQALKIPCLFMTGNVPARPRPDLTLGVLAKPFSDEAFFAALDVASKVIGGDEPVPTTLPPELHVY